MKEPKIRLKGFTGEWNETTIGDIAHVVGGGTPSTGNPVYWNGDIQWFTPSEVGKDKYVCASERTITRVGLDESSARLLPANSILLSSRATIGEMSINTCECSTNQGFQSLIPCNADLEFLYSLLLTKKNDLIRESNGSTFLEISANKVRAIELIIPKNDEQKNIGTFFNSLDSLIQSTNKKIESLKQVKAASLQSMFPQEGETTPRVRFKGFEGEWEKSTFGELLIFERPDNYIVSNDVYSDEFSTPVLTANKGFILGYTNERRTFNSPCIIFDDFTLDSKFVDFPFMVKSSALKILTLRNENKDSLYFVYTLLKQTKIEVLGHARHYISVVQPTQVYMPKDSTEQKMIASFFSNLDSQIALLSQQLEKLQQIKSACLDNMFV